MKKLSILLTVMLAVVVMACTNEGGGSNGVEEHGKFVSASVTRGGDNAKLVDWDVNAAQDVAFTVVSQGEKATLTVKLTGKAGEAKLEGDLANPWVLKLTPYSTEEKTEMPHELTAGADDMKAAATALKEGKPVEMTFTGEIKSADAPKLNSSKYHINVMMP